MLRWVFMLVLCLPMTALAAKSWTQNDLVGDWLCTAKDDEITRQTLMQYHADGTATEMIEDRYQYPDYADIEIMQIHYKWQVRDNRLYMSDHQLPDYWYYHQFKGAPLQAISEAATSEMKAQFLNRASDDDHSWHYVEFDGTDKHRAVFEDGFFVDCHRLK